MSDDEAELAPATIGEGEVEMLPLTTSHGTSDCDELDVPRAYHAREVAKVLLPTFLFVCTFRNCLRVCFCYYSILKKHRNLHKVPVRHMDWKLIVFLLLGDIMGNRCTAASKTNPDPTPAQTLTQY
jgi:hypothetical protein